MGGVIGRSPIASLPSPPPTPLQLTISLNALPPYPLLPPADHH